jgi:hypothetical protein
MQVYRLLKMRKGWPVREKIWPPKQQGLSLCSTAALSHVSTFALWRFRISWRHALCILWPSCPLLKASVAPSQLPQHDTLIWILIPCHRSSTSFWRNSVAVILSCHFIVVNHYARNGRPRPPNCPGGTAAQEKATTRTVDHVQVWPVSEG